jgi:LmbE family N-acetylglucosaminyl deacetylase
MRDRQQRAYPAEPQRDCHLINFAAPSMGDVASRRGWSTPSTVQALRQEGGGEAAVQASCSDGWKAATAVSSLDRSWAEELSRVAPLPTHLCRDLVVITAHPYEAVYGAGGLISYLALQGADVEVLAVTDGDEAAPLQRPSHGRYVRATYQRLGVPEVRRHRLHLESGRVCDAESDLIAAFSELVGHDCYPGLWCLAPWGRDGHPDHDAVGLAAEAVCRTYNLRLVRYLCAAWDWLQPKDLPWRDVRQFTLSESVRGRKKAAMALPPTIPCRDWVADRELFLV